MKSEIEVMQVLDGVIERYLSHPKHATKIGAAITHTLMWVLELYDPWNKTGEAFEDIKSTLVTREGLKEKVDELNRRIKECFPSAKR